MATSSNSVLPTSTGQNDQKTSSSGPTVPKSYGPSCRIANIDASCSHPSEEALKRRISEVGKIFIPTESFKHIQATLEQFGHVTICGAPGEGKTTMSLMLARDYMERGYEIYFIEKVDAFDFHECVRISDRLVFIFDDLLGTTDTGTLRTQMHSLESQIQDCRLSHKSGLGKRSNRGYKSPTSQEMKSRKDIKVVFTSRMFNVKDGMSRVLDQRMFTEQSVVDLTLDKKYCYSDEEKKAIFEKFRSKHTTVKTLDISTADVLVGSAVFGFPLTCRLYFELSACRHNAKDFFKNPLFYIRQEISHYLSLNNNQTGAVILMLLCGGHLDLTKLEFEDRNQETDKMIKHISDIIPTVSRNGIAQAAKCFRGIIFSEGETISFVHSSIYDACAHVLYKINPNFVLQRCSTDFLFERLKPGPVDKFSECDHFLLLSDSHYDILTTRLKDALKLGQFSKTLTRPLLENEQFVQLLFQKLENSSATDFTHWIRRKDRGKGFLYWAVQGHSDELVYEIENITNIRFTQNEICEALEGCVVKGNLKLLKRLLTRLEKDNLSSALNKLLLFSGEFGSREIAQYLLERKAQIRAWNKNKQNFIHITCKWGNTDMLRSVIDQIGSLVPRPNYLLAVHSPDINGRTPAMLAAMYGAWGCFMLLSAEAEMNIQDSDGDSTVHLAAVGGNRDIIQHVLTHTNINSRGMQGMTPLMLAASCGNKGMFDFLIANNADLTLVSNTGDSLLHLACQGGNINIVKHALTPSNINSRGENDLTPIMNAALYGHKGVFDYLISHNAVLTLFSDFGDSVLHLACQGGNRDIVQCILTPSNINVRGENCLTPVMRAACHGRKSVFDFLVSNNADLTLVNETGDRLLHLACRGGNRAIVQRVLTSSNINSRGSHGLTPAMIAAIHGHHSVFELLVSNNADLTLVDGYGDSLLYLACRGGNTGIVKYVLNPSNINIKGKYGLTPVMKAAVCGNPDVFDFLASKGADLTSVDEDGEDVLNVASCSGSVEISQRVLTPSNINKRGVNGWTAVMHAAYHGHKGLFDLLVENNADLTLVDDYGNSILHLACRGDNINIVQLFLKPSNINSRGMFSLTPAMVAAGYGQKSVFDFLVSNNADLTLTSKLGDSFLHLSCQGGNREIVKQLLTPSNINCRGNKNMTPIMVASRCGHKRVFDFLLSHNADITLVDDMGNNLLHLACLGGNKGIVQHVITPSNVNSKGGKGCTPIMMAAAKGHKGVFDFLLSNNADLTLLDDNHDSLLHWACEGGNVGIVQCILTPSNINSRGKAGWTPFMVASYFGHRIIKDLLMRNRAKVSPMDNATIRIHQFGKNVSARLRKATRHQCPIS